VSLQLEFPGGEYIFNLELQLSEAEIGEFESEVQSKLNGTLPIELKLGPKQAGFKVLKKGPGGPALSKNAGRSLSLTAPSTANFDSVSAT